MTFSTCRLSFPCELITQRQEKVLIFTQFQLLTKPLADFLAGVRTRANPAKGKHARRRKRPRRRCLQLSRSFFRRQTPRLPDAG